MIEIELPFPPSVNHYYRHVGSRVLISKRGRAFREKVCSILFALGVKKIEGFLFIEIEIYPPDNRRRDIDNLLKALLDSLQHGGLYDDDSQIHKLKIQKFSTIKNGKVIIRIGKLR